MRKNLERKNVKNEEVNMECNKKNTREIIKENNNKQGRNKLKKRK